MDPNLSITVAKNVAKTIQLYCVKAEQLVSHSWEGWFSLYSDILILSRDILFCAEETWVGLVQTFFLGSFALAGIILKAHLKSVINLVTDIINFTRFPIFV